MLKSSSIALLALFGAAPAAVAGTLNVPSQYPTIQDAINAAVDGDVVKVANGTFTENINLLGKQITVSGNGRGKSIILGSTGSVVTMASGETASTVLTGFSIRVGTGTSIGGLRYGGGVYIAGGSDPQVIDCAIGFNTADFGAGMFIDVGSDPLIQDCLIANNVTGSKGLGGGVYIAGNPILDGNRITENTATNGTGGGVYAVNTTTTFINNEFDKNHAFYGGGLHVNGGVPTITDNLFEENTVDRAPINGEGAGMAIVNGATPWVANNEIRLNKAHSGAGVYVYDAAPSIVTNLIHDNQASVNSSGSFGYGGGMSLGKGRGTIELNQIYFNLGALGGGVSTRSSTTTLLCGNIIDHNDTGTGVGGGLYSKDSTPTLLANTIAANSASKGGGLYVIGKSAPAIDTSIIYFNNASSNKSFFDSTGKLTFGFSDVEAASVGGTSISVDPQFADLANRNFSLLGTSPVIDSGNFAFSGGPTDIYGNPRVNGGRIDMGAVEN